jgi:hypothetical protein
VEEPTPATHAGACLIDLQEKTYVRAAAFLPRDVELAILHSS